LGSIDIENVVTFFAGTTQLGQVTGAQVVGANANNEPALNGCVDADTNNASFGCVALVDFDFNQGVTFDKIVFAAQGRNSFEFATPVPLPAAAWLLLAASGGLIAAKRRSARSAA
jgi:hypothetical protein